MVLLIVRYEDLTVLNFKIEYSEIWHSTVLYRGINISYEMGTPIFLAKDGGGKSLLLSWHPSYLMIWHHSNTNKITIGTGGRHL